MGTKNYSTFNRILDIIFLLSFSISYASVIKYILYAFFPISEALQRCVILGLVYIVRFRNRVVPLKCFDKKLFTIVVCLFVWEILQGLLKGSDFNAIAVVLINLAAGFIGLKYMINLLNEKDGLDKLITPNSYYSLYTFSTLLILVLLIIIGFVNPYSNPMSDNSLIATNVEEGVSYYFPARLSVVYNSPSVFLSLLGIPSFSGLSHESQAMYYAICPTFFLMFYKYRHKKNIDYRILLVFGILTLITASFTAIISFVATFIVHMLWKSRLSSNKPATFVYFIAIGVLFSIFFSSSIFQSYAEVKLVHDTNYSSAGYSLSLINYIFTPSSILGDGILSSVKDQVDQVAGNCGYVSSFMMILFFVVFIQRTLKSVFSRNETCHAIGLASLYFVLHSMKYGIALFNSTYIFFIVILLSYSEYIRKNKLYES